MSGSTVGLSAKYICSYYYVIRSSGAGASVLYLQFSRNGKTLALSIYPEARLELWWPSPSVKLIVPNSAGDAVRRQYHASMGARTTRSRQYLQPRRLASLH